MDIEPVSGFIIMFSDPQKNSTRKRIGAMTCEGTRIPIEQLAESLFRIATDQPESDGTLDWSETTLVLVQAKAGGKCAG